MAKTLLLTTVTTASFTCMITSLRYLSTNVNVVPS